MKRDQDQGCFTPTRAATSGAALPHASPLEGAPFLGCCVWKGGSSLSRQGWRVYLLYPELHCQARPEHFRQIGFDDVYPHWRICVTRHEQKPSLVAARSKLRTEDRSRHTGHTSVGNHDVKFPIPVMIVSQGFEAIAGLNDDEVVDCTQGPADHAPKIGVIVDKEHRSLHTPPPVVQTEAEQHLVKVAVNS